MSLSHHGAPPPAQADWAYFIDFDGTLVELAPTPDTIVVDAALPLLLAALQRACGGALALISGRAIADLERYVGLPTLAMAGQHGLERRDAAGLLWRYPASRAAKDAIGAALLPLVESHPGLLLEDKGMTLAVHYRQLQELASFVQEVVEQLVAESGEGLVVQHGKCVVEIKPAGANKATAVAQYLAEAPFRGRRPVFIGEDTTDADGFAAVNARGGISIGVGADDLGARYSLPNVAAVRAWLAGACAAPRPHAGLAR